MLLQSLECQTVIRWCFSWLYKCGKTAERGIASTSSDGNPTLSVSVFHCRIMRSSGNGRDNVCRDLLESHLAEQTVFLAPFVDHIDHIADVHTDAAGKLGVEEDVS